MSTSKVGHTGVSPVSPTLSAGPVGVGARSKKGGGSKIAWDDTVPSPQSHVSREYKTGVGG